MLNENLILAELSCKYGIILACLQYGTWKNIHDPNHKKASSKTMGYIATVLPDGHILITVVNHCTTSSLPHRFTLCSKQLQSGSNDNITDDNEIQEWLKKQAEAKTARDEKIKRSETRAQLELDKFFPELHPSATTKYLDSKGITAIGGIHLGWGNDDTPFLAIPACRFAGNKSDNIKRNIGYQRIYDNGSKYFQTGFSYRGSWFCLGNIANITDETTIYIVEGYATGVTCHEALGGDDNHVVIVAWNTGNLKPVAETFRKHYPVNDIVGLCDNDMWPNANGVASHAGVKYMTAAMNAVNGAYIVPNFEGLICLGITGANCHPTDFNDLACLDCIATVTEQLQASRQLPQKNDLPEYYENATIASQFLRDTIDVAFYERKSTIINGSAGLGKTQETCKAIAEQIAINPLKQFAFYVPNHDNAESLNNILSDLGVTGQVIKGRRLLCEKPEVPERLIALGGAMNVSTHCCENKETGEKCMDKCPYLEQFQGICPQVIIYPHAYLGLPLSKFERRLYRNNAGPDAIVIDESFYNVFEASTHVTRDDIFNCEHITQRIKNVVLDALDWGKPLLSTLRAENISVAELRACTENIPSHIPSFDDITPAMPTMQQMALLGKKDIGPYIKKPLLLIAEELEKTEHDECMGVHIVKGKTVTIHSHWMRPFVRNKQGNIKNPTPADTTFTPCLVLDASAKPQIIEKILGEFEPISVVDIHVRRNAHITQLVSATVSKQSLRKNDSYVNDVANVANSMLERNEKVGIFGPAEFVGNDKDGTAPCDALYSLVGKHGDNCSLGHFNALRGSNNWSGRSIVIFSRNQPPSHAVENITRAFYSMDKQELTLGMNTVPVAYNMADGTQEFVNSMRMIDSRCQLFMDSIREQETIQALDRARTIHHTGLPINIVIMSNLPLPGVQIDELVTTRAIRGNDFIDKTSAIVNAIFNSKQEGHNVLSLTPSILLKQLDSLGLGQLFKNAKSVKNWLVRNGSVDIENFLLSTESFNRPVKTVLYRVDGKGGKAMRAITNVSDLETQQYLSKIHKSRVTVINDLNIYGNKDSDINRIILNAQALTADDILEEIAGHLDTQKWHNMFFKVVENLSSLPDQDVNAASAISAILSTDEYYLLC